MIKKTGVGKNGNLRPRTTLSKEEAKEMGKLGAAKRTENFKRRQTFKELCNVMLDSKASKEEVKALAKEFPDLNLNELSNKALMIRQQITKAILTSDTKAFEVLRDTAGEKPVDKLETTEKKFKSVEIVDGEEIIELK